MNHFQESAKELRDEVILLQQMLHERFSKHEAESVHIKEARAKLLQARLALEQAWCEK